MIPIGSRDIQSTSGYGPDTRDPSSRVRGRAHAITLLSCARLRPLPLVAEATKAELYEIAGAFAKLASTPNGPGAAEVYEEVETTLGNAT